MMEKDATTWENAIQSLMLMDPKDMKTRVEYLYQAVDQTLTKLDTFGSLLKYSEEDLTDKSNKEFRGFGI